LWSTVFDRKRADRGCGRAQPDVIIHQLTDLSAAISPD
jgi:hypothetical protein